jgi:hypothetical protein
MASPLDALFDIVKRRVSERNDTQKSGGILGEVIQLIAQRAGGGKRTPRPASEDPYGDPADAAQHRKVKPASEDPYGDPADKK